MLVGSRVTDTIRTKVISTSLFESDPSVLMLAMTCAIVGSATYLTIATRFTMPVSTTHSIMGGVIGVGIASAGPKGVNWSFKGVSQVFAAWGIAPGISGIFGATIFLITKYGVMKRNNPVKKAFIMVPIYCMCSKPCQSFKTSLTLPHSLPHFIPPCSPYCPEGRICQDQAHRLPFGWCRFRRRRCRRNHHRHLLHSLPAPQDHQGRLGAQGIGSHQRPTSTSPSRANPSACTYTRHSRFLRRPLDRRAARDQTCR